MTGRTDSRGRLLFLLGCFVVAGVLLVLRTAYWQVIEGERLASAARLQTELTFSEATRRGTIYDRTGTVILATTLDRSRLVASPNQLTPAKRDAVAAGVVDLLGLEGAAAERVVRKMGEETGYAILADGIDESRAAELRTAIRERDLPAIGLEPYRIRSYPIAGGGDGSSLAAHLLGFVNSEGLGQYGVEQHYHEELAGQPRVVVAERDAAGRAVYGTERVVEEGSPGVDLALTIDAGLQAAVEDELFAAWVADRATSVSAVVMDPYTGEVYAEASYPSYDANRYAAMADEDPTRFVDPVVSHTYEPGSVFKLVTAAAALDAGVVTATTRVKDTSVLVLDGGSARVTNADRKGKGWLEFQDGIAYSRNVVAAKVAMQLGPTTRSAASALYRTWLRFGFGSPTGIDVAGEEAGLLKDPTVAEWRQIDLANGSFGQSVAVTPIQLAAAYAAMVNGGRLVTPRVVRAIGTHEVEPTPGEPVMGAADSRELTELMRHVVTEVPFYRDRTLVPGYMVGGKTGTAQIWDPKAKGGKGGWKPNIFNFSFVGFIGRENPRLVIAIRISEGHPTVNRPGEIVLPVMSFELFRRIGTDAMRMLDLPPVDTYQPATASR